MKYFVGAIWLIVTVCVASVMFHETVKESDMSKTKEYTIDKFYLAMVCFSLSFILTTALFQVYLLTYEFVRVRRTRILEFEHFTDRTLTKDLLHEIKTSDQ